MKQKQIRSRIKEFITDKAMDMLTKVYFKRNVDNNEKARMIQLVLDQNNIDNVLLGPGTNRVAFLIDGYVFKFAMDSWGIKDNYNELASSKELQPFVVKTYETCGLINVCEYVTLMSTEDFAHPQVEKIIVSTLSELSVSYLLGDVGYTAKNFTNWGYRDDGSVVILDYAYIYQIQNHDIICFDDGHLLEYNEYFTHLVCPHCRRKYDFMEIRRRISTTFEADEANSVLDNAYKLEVPKIYVPDDDEIDEDADYAVRRSDIIKDDETKVVAPHEELGISENEYFRRLGYDMPEEEDSMRDKLLKMMTGEIEPDELFTKPDSSESTEEELSEDDEETTDVDTDESTLEDDIEEYESLVEEEEGIITIGTPTHKKNSGAVLINFEDSSVSRKDDDAQEDEPVTLSIGVEPEEETITITEGDDNQLKYELDVEETTCSTVQENEHDQVIEREVGEQLSLVIEDNGEEYKQDSSEDDKYSRLAEEYGFDEDEDTFEQINVSNKKWR